jgi:methylated-DNA-protein-cysteine methyltransferase-like protein
MSPQSRYERIYAVIRRIPAGRVATYGQIAALAGFPGRARQVGYALYALRDGTNVPWHRVVNARGGLSLGKVIPEGDVEQRIRLEIEGVRFDREGRIALKRFQWYPRPSREMGNGVGRKEGKDRETHGGRKEGKSREAEGSARKVSRRSGS